MFRNACGQVKIFKYRKLYSRIFPTQSLPTLLHHINTDINQVATLSQLDGTSRGGLLFLYLIQERTDFPYIETLVTPQDVRTMGKSMVITEYYVYERSCEKSVKWQTGKARYQKSRYRQRSWSSKFV